MTYSDWERGINLAAVRAAVESGLAWIETDPARGVRNLIDLGGFFAHTRCQREFFNTARRLLSSRRCQYMRLIERALAGVDMDVLKTIGINLGYFSWSLGTRIIREIAAARGVFVPWSIMFRLDGARADALSAREVRGALEQARSMGAHSFWFNARGGSDYLAALVQLFGAFGDCAFMLIMDGALMTRELAQLARAQRNTIVCLDRSCALDDRATALLREARLLHGLSLKYDDSNARDALSGALLSAVERVGGHFALLLRGEACTESCARAVRDYALRERFAPARPAFTVDAFADMAQIDRNISAHECFIEVGPDGTVCRRPWSEGGEHSLRRSSLWDILRALARGL